MGICRGNRGGEGREMVLPRFVIPEEQQVVVPRGLSLLSCERVPDADGLYNYGYEESSS